MNRRISLVLSLALMGMAVAAATLVSTRPDARSVGPVQMAGMIEPPKFSRDESAGLFVGVRTFPHDRSLTVPFAVDDAVDLAHRFAFDQRVGLVPPRRVALAISGSPQKETSKQHLRELREAGATIANATSGDILELLKKQATLAGEKGLLVLSIATHGFQQNGDSYILGSTSSFGSPETSLRTATLVDVAAQARRSLIFIDACRDRVGQTSRGAAPDPAAAATHIRRMGAVQGQVIFYAAAPGHYAFDDEVHQNGVFTKAVLDGLDCAASAPRGAVLASTLHTYVERTVREWIETNRKVTVNPATQVSMEGFTRNMPLAECWRSAGPKMHVSFDGSEIAAYDANTRPLWRHDLGAPIVHAEVADLDADAFHEVVIGLRDRITVLDRDGKPRWNAPGDGLTLRTFTTGDLDRKHRMQTVALWNDERSSASRVTVLDDDGSEKSRIDHADHLQHVAIGRPTNRHDPKIVVATGSSVFLLHGKRFHRLWHQTLLSSNDAIRDIRIDDGNHDARLDIAVSTKKGTTWFTFDGEIVRQEDTDARWKDVAVR